MHFIAYLGYLISLIKHQLMRHESPNQARNRKKREQQQQKDKDFSRHSNSFTGPAIFIDS